MVHALEEIRRVLRPGGILVDIQPAPESSFIEAHQGGKVLFAERKRETCNENDLHAEEALAQAIERELFIVDRREEFDFLIYASSVRELRAYWEELEAYDDKPKDEAMVAREEDLYAQVELIMQATGAGSEVAIHDRARIARLRPVR